MAIRSGAHGRCTVATACPHVLTPTMVRGGTLASARHHSHRAVVRRSMQVCRAAVGIDLGTTSSALALIGPDGRPAILQDQLGKAIIPSVVSITKSGQVVVGEAAVQAAASGQVDAAAHFFSIKRLMGRMSDDVAALASKLPYAVVAHPKGWAGLCRPVHMSRHTAAAGTSCQADDDVMLPQELGAYVLRHLLDRAEAHLAANTNGKTPASTAAGSMTSEQPHSRNGVPTITLFPPLQHVTEAVITVPAHFSAAARAATIEAGRMAGLQRVELLQEPIAAAIAYGFGVGGAAAHSYDTLLVFDLGGGTFDVSLLEGWDGILEVLVTEGDDQLGGDDLTRALADLLLTKLPDAKSLQQLSGSQRLAVTQAAEELKCQLSATAHQGQDATAQVSLPGLLAWTVVTNSTQLLQPELHQDVSQAGAAGHGSHAVSVTQGEVQEAWASLLYRLWPPLLRLARTSGLQFGGRLPDAAQQANNGEHGGQSDSQQRIQGSGVQQVQQHSSNGAASPEKWQHELFPIDASESGNGSEKSSQKYVAPPRKLTGVVLVGAATRTPAVRSLVTQLCGMDPAGGADPEEVVALGAALQAGVLTGEVGYGAELTDGGYIASEHGRSSGWSSDSSIDWVP